MKKAAKIVCSLVLALSSAFAGATAITSALDPALSGATLIDFESVAAGDYSSLVLGGVTINGIGAPVTICLGCGGGSGSFGDVGKSLQNTGGSPASFDLVFDSAVSAFGIVGGAVNTSWVYTAYDASGVVIETLHTPNLCCSGIFNGIAASNIKRVNLNGSGDWVVFDNLKFVSQASAAVVPEPASIALFALGLGIIAVAARRKQS